MEPGAVAADVRRFVRDPSERPMLGLLYGRRRIGKSTLLAAVCREAGGFYYEAGRLDSGMQLERLGAALGRYLDVGPLALSGWDDAIDRLLRVARQGPLPVVVDEFGYILEADESVPSLIASALGPGPARADPARLVLCGSAIAMMGALTAGQAPLRGRASKEWLMWPDGYRVAATRLPDPDDLDLAVRVYAVIGGVVGYATDMVAFDLPAGFDDFDRWVVERVLSPAATLHHEATTLLAEDPTLTSARSLHHHSILAAIGGGAHTTAGISRTVRRPASVLNAALDRLVAAGFVSKHDDPIRGRRPTYQLADPYLQFHYALLEPNRRILGDRPQVEGWRDCLREVFDSQVRGPVFEEQVRMFLRRHASDTTLGGSAAHIGPSTVVVDGVPQQVDAVVAGDGTEPAARPVYAVAEAKAGKILDMGDLSRLQRIRAVLGSQAAEARLLLFGRSFTDELRVVVDGRADVDLIDHHRLYHGE